VNLKAILMHLGNALVSRGYDPANLSMLRQLRATHRGSNAEPWRETGMNRPYQPEDVGRERLAGGLELLVLLTEWLNAHNDAQECLAELGVEWPVVQPPEPPDAEEEESEIERLRDEVRHWKGHADQYKADLDAIINGSKE